MPADLSSADKLFAKHSSKPYNPKLANVFFKSGMIEAWGRGFEKIKEACKLYDGPLPEYDITATGIMVLCKACDKYLEMLNKNEPINEPINEPLNEPLNLDERGAAILAILAKTPHTTQKDLIEQLNVSRITIRRCLEELANKNLIERQGSKKTGMWKVKIDNLK